MDFATDISTQDAFQTEVLSTPGVLQGREWFAYCMALLLLHGLSTV
jgi:hypothetical protein